jgi:tetratricopeptide (TPR) repeat protein
MIDIKEENITVKHAGIRIISLLVFFISLLSLNSLLAQSYDDFMIQGNKYYGEGNYKAAIEEYNKILKTGFESSTLYYNIGNAYFKSGRLGYAVYNYEKGLKLSPGDEDLLYNLRIVNARTVDEITEVPQIFIVQWWNMIITAFSVTGWSFVVILIYLVFIVSIGLYLLSKKYGVQKKSFFISSASLAVLIISVVILISRYNHEVSSNYGVLLEANYTVKISPDEKSNDAFVIHEGIKFLLEDKVGEWYRIRLIDGKVGWIQSNTFGKI